MFCLVVTLLAVLALPASSQVRDTFGDWQLACDLDGCTMLQGLKNPARPSVTYSSEIKFVESADRPVLFLNFPLGVYLPPGIGLEIGSVRRDVPFAMCLPRGCQALVALDDGMLGALNAASTYRVRFNPGEATPAELEFSLEGFGDAYQALVERR